MSYHTKVRAPLKIIFHDGEPYVRETIVADGKPVMGTPIHHGPFVNHAEASRFLMQRNTWLQGWLLHIGAHKFKEDMPPYPEFIFNGIACEPEGV
jgi:hypothetical protein